MGVERLGRGFLGVVVSIFLYIFVLVWGFFLCMFRDIRFLFEDWGVGTGVLSYTEYV